jgi:mRNA-degrading endonuclease toxin of MazEF toxin-antitoxin module
MTGYEFGDIVLVPFPFTDQSTTKRRPAVVISSLAYHRDRPDLIIMAVTSQRPTSGSVGEVKPALFTRVRDETAETPCETGARSREEGKHT